MLLYPHGLTPGLGSAHPDTIPACSLFLGCLLVLLSSRQHTEQVALEACYPVLLPGLQEQERLCLLQFQEPGPKAQSEAPLGQRMLPTTHCPVASSQYGLHRKSRFTHILNPHPHHQPLAASKGKHMVSQT